MARPIRALPPEADALWADALARHEAGTVTIDDLVREIGFSRATIYRRFDYIRERLELYSPDELRAPLDDLQAPGPIDRRPEIDEAPFVTLTHDPLSLAKNARDYSQDDIIGEPAFDARPFYNLNNDACTLESGPVLVGSRNGASTLGGGGGHRLPSPRLEGQRLRRTRLGTGRIHTEEEPKSEGRNVNDADKAEGVVFVQPAAKGKAS